MKRAVEYSWKNIRRSPFQAIGSIFILFLTFAAAQIFILTVLGSNIVIKYFSTRPQVTAFFTDQIDEPTILNIKAQLESQPYVSKVTYVSKQDALKLYREENKNDPLLLEMVTADILPPSLEVSAKDMSQLPQINNDLKQISGIDEVVYQKDVIDALQKWTNGIQTAGLSLVAFLIATSLLITTIIISMKVASKRYEIKVMRLLGATPWFVRGPFIVEGALYGIISAVVSWTCIYVLILYATPILVAFMGDIPLLPIPLNVMLMILGGCVSAGIVVGSMAGSISTSRYE